MMHKLYFRDWRPTIHIFTFQQCVSSTQTWRKFSDYVYLKNASRSVFGTEYFNVYSCATSYTFDFVSSNPCGYASFSIRCLIWIWNYFICVFFASRLLSTPNRRIWMKYKEKLQTKIICCSSYLFLFRRECTRIHPRSLRTRRYRPYEIATINIYRRRWFHREIFYHNTVRMALLHSKIHIFHFVSVGKYRVWLNHDASNANYAKKQMGDNRKLNWEIW